MLSTVANRDEISAQSVPKKSDKDVDLTNAARGVWLVKIPKYISDRWNEMRDEEDGNVEIDAGMLTIARRHKMKPNVSFSLSDSICGAEGTKTFPQPIPKDHKFVISSAASQTLVILSGDVVNPNLPDFKKTSSKNLVIEGRVVQRAECRPQGTSNVYMNLKKEAIMKAIEPNRQAICLDRAVVSYKPKSSHASSMNERTKKNATKMLRDEKPVVLDRLFLLFEKHQYYNIKDLVRQTRQPISYLKEILNEVCIYNMKAPHRNMWELKPEYRHYDSNEKKEKGDERMRGDLSSSDDEIS